MERKTSISTFQSHCTLFLSVFCPAGEKKYHVAVPEKEEEESYKAMQHNMVQIHIFLKIVGVHLGACPFNVFIYLFICLFVCFSENASPARIKGLTIVDFVPEGNLFVFQALLVKSCLKTLWFSRSSCTSFF